MSPDDLEPKWQHALREAQRLAGEALPDAAIARVERELQRNLQGAPPRSVRKHWAFAFAGAFATIAAVVGGIAWQQRRELVAPTLAQATLPATVERRAGSVLVGSEGIAWPVTATAWHAEEPLQLAPDARVDVRLSDGTRVRVRGPAQITLASHNRPKVDQGSAAFTVLPHEPTRPFRALAGRHEIVVTGTRFTTYVDARKLKYVAVTEGTVRVEDPTEPTVPAIVAAGSSWGTPPSDAAPTDASLDSDSSTHGNPGQREPSGYVSITSTPSGANVTLDGQSVGPTPVLMLVAPGAHQARLSLQGYEAWEHAGPVAMGLVAEWSANLAPVPAAPRRLAPKNPDLFVAAESALRERNCKAVAARVKKIVSEVSAPEEQARAKALLAECHLRRGERTKALELFVALSKQYAGTLAAEPALFQAAVLAQELGRTQQARAYVERYLERYPKGALVEPALIRQCELIAALGKAAAMDDCLARYRKAFPKGPHAAEVIYLLAIKAQLQEDWPETARLFLDYLNAANTEPDHRDEALYRRILALKQGKLPGVEAAIDAYRRQFPNGKHIEVLGGAHP